MPGGPGPLARAVEELAVAHVVAELELLVREQVAVRVQDALGDAGGAGRVVELGGVVGRRCPPTSYSGRGRRPVARLEVVAHHEHPLDQPLGDAVAVGRVGDDEPSRRSRAGGARCPRRRRAPTSTAGSRRACRCRGRPRPSRAATAAASPRGRRAPRRAPRARWRSGSTGPGARRSSPGARCPASPPRPSRAGRARACRRRRARCCSAPAPPSCARAHISS